LGSSSLSSPPSKEVDFRSLTSSEIDFWKENIRNLFLDPVESIKPTSLSLDDLDTSSIWVFLLELYEMKVSYTVLRREVPPISIKYMIGSKNVGLMTYTILEFSMYMLHSWFSSNPVGAKREGMLYVR
ncbi:hypothetical protein HAX54_041635, partial [Datura stramonium]|nr:hypothetical protein [Datura stramonium]